MRPVGHREQLGDKLLSGYAAVRQAGIGFTLELAYPQLVVRQTGLRGAEGPGQEPR
jgi:hypothetical protein